MQIIKAKQLAALVRDVSAYYATKNVMSAEGGIVITTNDRSIARRCRMIRAHGMERRYYHDMLGYNFRLSDLHAAIRLVQLQRLQEFTQKRRRNASYLNTHIQNPKVITPSQFNGKVETNPAGHVWHQYTVRIVNTDRDQAIKSLTNSGIGTGIFYPVPAHQQNHIRELGLGDVSLPVTEKMAEQVLSLPVHPQLSQTDLETIVEAVNSL